MWLTLYSQYWKELSWKNLLHDSFFFVIVWKLIQDSRYDREPIFQFALLLFADLLPFNSYGRKVFTTINQSKLQKSNIQHGKLFKNIELDHSEFSIRLFMLTFSIHDFFWSFKFASFCSKLAGVYRFKEDYA